MKCFYCNNEFQTKIANRKFCYNCLPEELSIVDKNYIRRRLIVDKADREKLKIGCSKCGYNKCAKALEWHHYNDDKNFNPANLLGDGTIKKYELYQEEIKKCILLCANCHREEHALNNIEIIEVRKQNLSTPKNITREELKELIRTIPFTQIGVKFNVSDNMIRKWCDAYSLPRTKKEINSYSNEEWDLI